MWHSPLISITHIAMDYSSMYMYPVMEYLHWDNIFQLVSRTPQELYEIVSLIG